MREREAVSPQAPPRDDRGHTLLEVSNAVVRIHKEYYGKGPTKARSHLSQDLLTVVLEGGFTRSEHTLLEHGHPSAVANSRAAMQDAVAEALCNAVEEILERPVRSFMSANDPQQDLQAEVFVLTPHAQKPDADANAGLGDRARRAREQHREILDEHRALRAEQAQARRRLGSASEPES